MPDLKVLKLGDNKLGLDGFRELCMALNDNETIEKLYLGDNEIRGEAVWGLLSGLFMYNHTLTEIYLSGNDLSGCTEKTWKALARNRTLQLVDLRDSLQDIGAWVQLYTAFQTQSSQFVFEFIRIHAIA